MPTGEQIKQFLAGTVVPLATGAIVTWLAGTKVLSVFGITGDVAAAAISQVLVFAVSAGIGLLVTHHILAGHYAPGAKAAARKRDV